MKTFNMMSESCHRKLRERSFLILGTGAEDFWQGYETLSIILWGYQNIKSNSYGVRNYVS